jgi:hypothetical protein
MVFFITGSHGSGKSTVLPRLQARFPEMAWHAFEGATLPKGSGIAGRQQATEQWIRHVLHDEATGRDAGVCGGCVPGELFACPSAPLLRDISICLLECSDPVVRADRLRARPKGGLTQEALNWGMWLRMHADDPQWRQDVIRAEGWEAMRWERWASWQRGDPRWDVWVLDTVHLTVEDTTERLAAWIAQRRGSSEGT